MVLQLNKKSRDYLQKSSNKSEDKYSVWSHPNNPPVLLKYQRKWFLAAQKEKILVIEKSRRIGISWADACISVLDAAREKSPTDTYYIGYNKDMTSQYIEDCAYWAKAFNIAGVSIKRRLIEKEDQDILIYKIKFANGRKIIALNSKPTNIRSKKGNIVIDEAAFHQDLKGLLKAALALTMWGGQVRVISTHDSEQSYFFEIIKNIKQGDLNYYHQKTTFKRAIKDGFYKRVCLVKEQEYSVEEEVKYVQEIYDQYGTDADEELNVIPRKENELSIFRASDFNIITEVTERLERVIRFWDFAASAKTYSFYTAGILVGKTRNQYIVLDVEFAKLNAAEAENFFVSVAYNDTKDIPQYFELEPGSAGLKYQNALKNRMKGFKIIGIPPKGDKLTRALPVASEIKRGNFYVLDKGKKTKIFISEICRFYGQSEPLITDLTDALSGAFDVLNNPKPLYLV